MHCDMLSSIPEPLDASSMSSFPQLRQLKESLDIAQHLLRRGSLHSEKHCCRESIGIFFKFKNVLILQILYSHPLTSATRKL